MIDQGRSIKDALLEVKVLDATLILHPYKGLFWPDMDMLIVSDLHLGKVQHFRNAGIYIPPHASLDNYERLASMLLDFHPSRLLFLGDLFHSIYNRDWANFCELRNTFSKISFELVPGNHDIIDQDLYSKNDIILQPEILELEAFTLSHHPQENSIKYNIAGHIHPGVRLVGDGQQSMKLPAFYFGERAALLPSFGTFTGMSIISPVPGDQVVAISSDQLFLLSTLS